MKNIIKDLEKMFVYLETKHLFGMVKKLQKDIFGATFPTKELRICILNLERYFIMH